MKIAVLIPDRKDRPELLKNCIRMIAAQTVQPDIIEIVDDEPLSNECDITWRYRTGYDRLRKKGIDVIAFIENDDYYSPQYLETMVAAWLQNGQPELLGTNYTIYYHLKLKAHFTMYHNTRASAMNTLIIPDLNVDWCKDSEPYTDMHLWSKLKGVVFRPTKHISIGMKHGTGLCGGHMHLDRLHRYAKHGVQDPDFSFLKNTLDENSFNFYSTFCK